MAVQALVMPTTRIRSLSDKNFDRMSTIICHAANKEQKDKIAAYVADKGLEGSGPMSVVNKIAPSGFRFSLYALFGVIGAAGVGIAVSQGNLGDAGINGIVLIFAAGAAFFDAQNQGDQVEATKAAMDNESLAKDLYSDENTAQVVAAGAVDDIGTSRDAGAGSRIMTAADLLGDQAEGEGDSP